MIWIWFDHDSHTRGLPATKMLFSRSFSIDQDRKGFKLSFIEKNWVYSHTISFIFSKFCVDVNEHIRCKFKTHLIHILLNLWLFVTVSIYFHLVEFQHMLLLCLLNLQFVLIWNIKQIFKLKQKAFYRLWKTSRRIKYFKSLQWKRDEGKMQYICTKYGKNCSKHYSCVITLWFYNSCRFRPFVFVTTDLYVS